MTGELHHDVASEPAGVFNENDPGPIAEDIAQHLGEAVSAFDWISAAHSGIVVLLDDLYAMSRSIGANCILLAEQAVLIRTNIGC